MRVLLLNQTYAPDVVSTAQYASDLAEALIDSGHSVEVIAGKRGYADPNRQFPSFEVLRGVHVHRVGTLPLAKRGILRRILIFASFIVTSTVRLLRQKKPDVLIALSSPPLISALAALYSRITRVPLVYWVMDLNPDEAVAAGYLRTGSILHRFLEKASRFAFSMSALTVVLDRHTESRIRTKGITLKEVAVIPPWIQSSSSEYSEDGRNRFREQHGLENKFVVLYSGNLTSLHPVDSLLEAAAALRNQTQILFVFSGAGGELPKIDNFARTHQLENIRTLAYTAREELSHLLSAADLQVVIMGDPMVGIIHPSKIYNILSVGTPILYIGPKESPIADILTNEPQTWSIRHGESASIVDCISSLAAHATGAAPQQRTNARSFYSEDTCLKKFITAIEQLVPKDRSN